MTDTGPGASTPASASGTSTGTGTVLVLGGARSGKSAVAESLVGERCVYVATGTAEHVDPTGSGPVVDPDMAARIEAHRARRAAGWSTIESIDVVGALADHPSGDVLVDSLGTWVAGHDGFTVDVDGLLDALRRRSGLTVLVSDEVGLGVHPSTEVGRRFRDALGEVNRRVGEVADRVVLVVAGRVLEL